MGKNDRESNQTHRVRSVAAVLLVILTAVSITAATIGAWVHETLLDTDATMDIVESAIKSEEFTDAVGTRISVAAIEALDLEARFETRLSALDQFIGQQLVETLNPDPAVLAIIERLDPPRFADLAGPMSTATNEMIMRSIDGLVSSEQFQSLLVGSVRGAHEVAVALVTEDAAGLENVYIAEGKVKWDAIPLVVAGMTHVIEEGILQGEEITLPDLSDSPIASDAVRRLEDALNKQLPEDFGQITIMSENDLLVLRNGVRTFDRSVWILIATSAALLVAALWVSPNRRRTAIQLGLATVVALAMAGLTLQAAVEAFQEGITELEGRAAARVMISKLLDSLRNIWWVITLTALLVGIAAYAAGRPAWVEKGIESSRRTVERGREANDFDRFVARYFDLLSLMVIGLGLLILWLTGLQLAWFLIVLVFVGGSAWLGQSARWRVAQEEESPDGAKDSNVTLRDPSE